MKLRGMCVTDLRFIVERISTNKYSDNLICDAGDLGTKRVPGTNFTLAVRSSFGPGARRSGSGRRMPKACWHAHRDVMVDIFTLAPDARLTSALADYRGLEDFLAAFPHTAHTNVGSQMQPAEIGSLCECVNNGVEGVQWSRAHHARPEGWNRDHGDWTHQPRPQVTQEFTSGDAMRWDPKQADDEIAEWAKILRKDKS